MWNAVITREEYRRTLAELMRCEFWLALRTTPSSFLDFCRQINTLTEAYYFSNTFKPEVAASDNAGWQDMLARLFKVYAKKPSGYFEEMWRLLLADYERRLDGDLQQARQTIERSFYGFTYEYHPEYYSADDQKLLTLHFRNYFAPDSPFNHLPELAQGLARIAFQSKAERPEVTRAQCATWINNLPAFRELFPREWAASAKPCPLEGHAGCWGQLVDRRGFPHRANIDYLFQFGRLRFDNVHCKCSLGNLVG